MAQLHEQKVKIHCKNNHLTYTLPQGSSLDTLYRVASLPLSAPVMCAEVEGCVERLDYPLMANCSVQFITLVQPQGMHCYVRSLCFILYKAITTLYPSCRLRIGHAVSQGYMCYLDGCKPLDAVTVAAIKQCMEQLVASNYPFEQVECSTQEAIALFRRLGRMDKVDLLLSYEGERTHYDQMEGTIDHYYSTLVPSTGYITTFDLIPYGEGMLLLPPISQQPTQVAHPIEQPKMLQVFKENSRFNHIARLGNIGALNRVVMGGDDEELGDMIRVTEALQEKQIAHIADEIALRQQQSSRAARVVLIAGPSSSGKTTFAKRLSIQLMTNLIRPLAISVDNYFVDREETPRDAMGEYDYESLYAVDLALFNNHITRLLAGERVEMPTYNFALGKKEYLGNTIQLEESTTLILEGIHALNPEMTPLVDPDTKFMIYVSALTSITIDDHNWIPTTDNRLLRRIIRDHHYRNVRAESTIARWESVKRGEQQWIFPYQENADAMFNSSLLFELAVLKHEAMPLLQAVGRESEHYSEAQRLLTFMSYFHSIPEERIPRSSLLREFIGGSSFDYFSR